MCVLNNLYVPELPSELAGLNNFEKILIQRMKAFQTVVKMYTVAKKIFPTTSNWIKFKAELFF